MTDATSRTHAPIARTDDGAAIIDLRNPNHMAEAHGLYAELREEAPVVKVRFAGVGEESEEGAGGRRCAPGARSISSAGANRPTTSRSAA